MLDKKYIWAIFLFEFKMGHKAAETTSTIALGQGTANECTVQWWLKKLCKGDKSLGDEEWDGWPLQVDNNPLRASSKLMLLQLHRKLPKNSMSTSVQSFGI